MGLSVIIIAKNEEKNIRRCLESVQFADEIIVLDSGSSDHTVAIAKEYTKSVFSTDWPGYGAQKQRALSKASKDWVLNLDADEAISERLQQEMLRAMASGKFDAYRVAIQMNFYEKPLKYSSSPKRHARLFKRTNAHFSTDIVHEKIILPKGTRIGKLNNPIMHHSFKDVSHVLYKMNRYSSYSAKMYIAKQRNASFTKTLVSTSWMFFRCYILQRGFLDGKIGFLFAVFNAQGAFYRGVKQIYQDSDIEQLPNLINHKEDLV
ncbi:MAG: glycosyltransferase family 2 protein [Legionella sp.]|uniref:glycosyltransferase family 2 protein n=1 Tax=Legionella sp. TaxID=459 RepID=UPI0039E22202